ncbi:hypothetical protein FHS51_003780 [Sphingobium wenxiniae]|uniref:Uncharacterized protein n=1 Tax=Sphingobium wenxiniae (strain DSM 21828 / CGMCC 1.7748 / JZ-1) TaxID=595605 RepID=A0A562K4R8_SPHWJ|nr:hypothetical protein [Sphingobium wenxiniae]MBB6193523.1 hypothetical protein [Sphingobium wenxiniae]TWH90205.1 hypothetical protein IQ35_03599 [Sphingobium wenxiniae]
MSAIHLALDIPCTRDEAARLFAVLIFLAELETDPDAKPGPELDATFGANAREALLGIIGHPVPLGIDCRYDPVTNLLSVTDVEGRPNLSAVPVLLLWLYPDKLPLAYAVHTAEHPEHKVWTLIGLNRIEITEDAASVETRLAALRSEPGAVRRIALLPTRPLLNGD